MRPGWRAEIFEEYHTAGKPFLGVIERKHGFAHLIGCSVYPPDWRTRAPLLANVLQAPDLLFGAGRGQAFDTYAAPETVPQAAESKRIAQIWQPPLPFSPAWMLKSISSDVALFHQCKDASAIAVLRAGLSRNKTAPLLGAQRPAAPHATAGAFGRARS